MHANRSRQAGAVLLTVAAGAGLLLRCSTYAASVGWDARDLVPATVKLRGGSICPGDRTGVWFEGSAHLGGSSGYASLHTGAAAWYILAARHINPRSATTPISAQ